jgi:hypothetical protein
MQASCTLCTDTKPGPGRWARTHALAPRRARHEERVGPRLHHVRRCAVRAVLQQHAHAPARRRGGQQSSQAMVCNIVRTVAAPLRSEHRSSMESCIASSAYDPCARSRVRCRRARAHWPSTVRAARGPVELAPAVLRGVEAQGAHDVAAARAAAAPEPAVVIVLALRAARPSSAQHFSAAGQLAATALVVQRRPPRDTNRLTAGAWRHMRSLPHAWRPASAQHWALE